MTELLPPVKFHSLQQVQDFAQNKDRDLLILQDCVLDVTTFTAHHPGGGALLRNLKGKDISAEMKWHHPLTLKMANTMAIGSFHKEIKRIITPERAFMPQIWQLNHEEYMNVIHSPHWLFVPSPRMFQSDFLEALTHCKWYMALLMPTIVVSYMFSQVQSWKEFEAGSAIFAAASGLLFFTLVEYCLHRFIFHCEQYLPDSRLVRYIHFMSHGIHHMLPNDPDRLVLPPPFYMVVFTLGYFTVGQVLKFNDPIFSTIFWSLFQMGYAIYDTCHYALHHIDTSKSKKGYFVGLQRYHNQHHFGGEQAGFGVSSSFWDIIFRTGFKRTIKANQ